MISPTYKILLMPHITLKYDGRGIIMADGGPPVFMILDFSTGMVAWKKKCVALKKCKCPSVN